MGFNIWQFQTELKKYNNKFYLKGSYVDAKNNIMLCIWRNVMCFKLKIFSTFRTLLLLLYAPP